MWCGRFFVFGGVPDISPQSPAAYFPLRSGRYTVTPSLHRLGTDFGNGERDACLFQFDREFPRFRENKRRCRSERFLKYVRAANLPDDVEQAAVRVLSERLVTEYPGLFSWVGEPSEGHLLLCRLTGELLRFDSQRRLVEVTGADSCVAPTYTDSLDALCCQFPEDLAIICRDPTTGDDRLAFLHLCAPSHWAAEEKIGRSWSATHAPVPNMEKSRDAAASIVRVMIEREPMVRFTWGIEFDDLLNHHPEPPPTIPAAAWNHRGRRLTDAEPFYLRVERQVIWGLPGVDASLFTIRVYHTPGSAICADAGKREALSRALRSMSAESRRYKGLENCVGDVLARLSDLSGAAGS